MCYFEYLTRLNGKKAPPWQGELNGQYPLFAQPLHLPPSIIFNHLSPLSDPNPHNCQPEKHLKARSKQQQGADPSHGKIPLKSTDTTSSTPLSRNHFTPRNDNVLHTTIDRRPWSTPPLPHHTPRLYQFPRSLTYTIQHKPLLSIQSSSIVPPSTTTTASIQPRNITTIMKIAATHSHLGTFTRRKDPLAYGIPLSLDGHPGPLDPPSLREGLPSP